MGVIKSTVTSLLVFALVLVLFPNYGIVRADPKTIIVPDDFLIIQEAVNAANPGDTIFVRAGTYQEIVIINKNNLVLTGENRHTTIIDGGGGTNQTVRVDNADNVEIKGFTIQNGYDGIYFYDSSFGVVSGNIITNCSFRGIILSCSSFVAVSGNTLENNHDGVELYRSSFGIVSGNTITKSRFGIGMSQSFNNTFSENSITNSEDGIYIWNSSYITASRNTITNNTENGISITHSSYCNFSENTITNSSIRGISLGNSMYCNVSENTIKFSANQGIHSFFSSSNTISENILTSNFVCLGFYMSSRTIVFGNSISKSRTGITVVQADNIVFYHNDIISNSFQVSTGNSSNIWDDGSISGGNYWSDYTGTETDRNGIGDTPYIIDENNQDNYPLLEPYTGTPVEKREWFVDDDGSADFSTIQEAINHAITGDTIIVNTGTYHEHIVVNKTVSLLGNDRLNTIIDGSGSGAAVAVTSNSVNLSGFTIKNAGLSSGSFNGLIISSNNNTISNNVITANSYHGLYLIESNYNSITNNEIFLNYWCGIVLKNSDYNTINENILTQNRKQNNGAGILLLDSSDFNTITGNIVSNHAGGIGLDDDYPNGSPCFSNLISLNYIFDNEFDGIFIYSSCEQNRIEQNNLRNNGGGIHLLNSDKNMIVENTILNSSYGGIGFEDSEQNSFYHNTLIGNTPQVYYFSLNNSWDNGYPSGGNYWSDYIGADSDEDGIGDSPYIIDDINQDNYPFMSPYNKTIQNLYVLKLDSIPSGVTFVLNSSLCSVPWSDMYVNNTIISLKMPDFYVYEGKNFTWSKWNDENTNTTRTLTITKNITLTGIFLLENKSSSMLILSPENKTYSTIDIPLEFIINGTLTEIRYSLDGQANTTVSNNTTLIGLSKGPHSIIMYGDDSSNNTISSQIVYFTVNVPSVGFSIVSPKNTTYNTSDVRFGLVVNETFTSVSYSLDEQSQVDAENATILSGLDDGLHELTVIANFGDNNVSESITVWFAVDTVPPNITNVTQLAVADNGTLEDGVKVNSTVADSMSGVNWVVLNYTNGNGNWVIAEMINLEGEIWNGTLPAFPHGTNVTYIIIAEDKAGNTITTEELFGQPNQYQVLPEFPSLTILPLIFGSSLVVIIVRKKFVRKD
ncbi:MAG: NosD domain-containing protein [Candidatus Bathyarchaeota archaeon]